MLNGKAQLNKEEVEKLRKRKEGNNEYQDVERK
jgi:hypothetical protein